MDAGHGRASRTAVLTAVARALHREEAPPWVFDDYLAAMLAGDDGAAVREELVASVPTENLLAFTRWVCVRARVPEDLVERAVTAGQVRQYVILGAGLDSFAYRRADLADRVTVFEVDHPSTQTWKRDRLREAGVDVPGNVVFAPVDFEQQTLRAGLEAAGFDFHRPTVWSWIGVTMYLTLEAIEATLDTVAHCSPGSRLVLTYNQPRSALAGMGAQTEAILARIASEMGEPFISLFRPKDIEQLVRAHGFGDVEHFGPERAMSTYFRGRNDVRFGGAQRLIAATVA